MKKFEGTPAPWKAEYSSVISVETDEIIAVMTCGSVYRKNELEDYDTARLIAAAPCLLEALVDCLDSMRDAFPNYDHYESDAYLKAQAAIAKALGEEL